MQKYFRIAYLIVILSTMLGTAMAYAAWYVIDKDDKVVGKLDYEPNMKELEGRNEDVVFSKTDVDLSKAEFRANKIVEHKQTQKEKDDIKAKEDIKSELSLIDKRAMRNACKELEKEGTKFTKVTCDNL